MVAYFFSGVRARPRIRPADRSVGIAAARRIKSKWSEDILPSSTQGSLSGGQGTEPLRGLEEPLRILLACRYAQDALLKRSGEDKALLFGINHRFGDAGSQVSSEGCMSFGDLEA